MRIIGGDLRGKKLHSVRGVTTRPTADRLREAIFNILSLKVRGSIVLDLFAGTGALGIEALSRGAEAVVFVDRYKGALSIIEKNISSCNFNNRSKIIRWNIIDNLNCIKSVAPSFNLVFMDPPYNKNIIYPVLSNLHASKSVQKNAIVIIEHSPSEPIKEDIAAFEITDQRKYGQTLVSFLKYII